MSKTVDGASGCSGSSGASLSIIVSKFQGMIKRQSEASGSSDGQKSGNDKNAGTSEDNKEAVASGSSSGGTAADGNGSKKTESGGKTTGNSFDSGAEDSADGGTEDTEDTAETCIVTYKNGNETYAQQEVEKGKSVKKSIGQLPENPSDDRAEFDGWWTGKMGDEGRKRFTAATCVKEDITVYGKWLRTLRYYVNEGVVGNREVEIETPDAETVYDFSFTTNTGSCDINDWSVK